jgi:integrase
MAGRHPHAVRLAGGRPGTRGQSRRRGTRPQIRCPDRKTPVLAAPEARHLLDSINTKTVVGMRDQALIGLLVFTFARIGAALGMTVADVYWQHRRLWVRLHEKGGKQHSMPCHHNLESYLWS